MILNVDFSVSGVVGHRNVTFPQDGTKRRFTLDIDGSYPLESEVLVPNITKTELFTGQDVGDVEFYIIIPESTGTLAARGTNDADSFNVCIRANTPFILAGDSIPSGSVTFHTERIDPDLSYLAAAGAIRSVYFYQATGSSVIVRVYGFGGTL